MKKLFWAIASIFIAGVSIWAVAFQQKNFSFGDFFEFALNSHPAWLIGAVLCMFGFIWFEGNALRRVACSLGHRTSFLRGTVYGAADVYFSAITPSATGGQPASAYFMLADGIPGPVVTVCLIINLVMYTLALLTVGLFSLICYFDVFLKFSLISQVLIVIGVVIQIALAIGFVLLLKKPQILYGFMTKVMVLLEKMHLLRHGQKKRDKLNRTIDEYAECAQMITGHRRMLIELFGWNLLQRISQVSVTLMAFMATGHSLATSWRAWVTQCFVALGSNSIPIPGAMGVADGLMLDGLSGLTEHADVVTMELLCRGLAFYGCMITSICIVVVGYVHRRLQKGKKGISKQ